MKRSKIIISLLAISLCGTLSSNIKFANYTEQDQSTQIDFFSEYRGQVVETTKFTNDIRGVLPEQYTIPKESLYSETDVVSVQLEETVLNDGSILILYSRKGYVETENGRLNYSEVYFDDNSAIISYYCESWNYIRQDYYKEGKFIESNNRFFENQLSDNIIKLTDIGWGYSFRVDTDNHSFCCPQSVLDNRPSSYYKRLNIEVLSSVETNTQEDFLNYTNDLARAEQKIERNLESAAYD